MQKPSIQDITDFLIAYTSTMLGSGTYTARVAKCVERIGDIYGYEVHINFFLHHSTINVVDKEEKSIHRTYVIPNQHTLLNFKLILDLSALSWAIYDRRCSLESSKKAFEKINLSRRHPFVFNLFLVSFANAAFCGLFGGDLGAGILVFLGTIMGFSLRHILAKIKTDIRIIYILCSFLSSWIVFLGVSVNYTTQADIALGSSILYLIPGVFFINAIIDILKDYVLMGISRIVSIIILLCCMATGIYMTLSLSNFGVLQ